MKIKKKSEKKLYLNLCTQNSKNMLPQTEERISVVNIYFDLKTQQY